MRLKLLFHGNYEILGVMNGDECEAENFLRDGEATTQSSREGLASILQYIADNGLQNTPSAWVHEANKREKIYEFIKGDLRLFFFKGNGNRIAVCTAGVLKKGGKANKAAVAKATEFKDEYIAAVAAQTIEVIEDEDE